MEVHTFSSGIGSKVKMIARQKFELTYNEVAVQHFIHCTTGTPLIVLVWNRIHFIS